ncbi:MAG TPA: ElyC/SanA/YdcF family protein [Anaerolineales bacterium]|nr:ElyC/SanA/YdcF family protein [Anaerolineales bacterium]
MLKRLTKLTFRIVSYAAILALLTILLTRMVFLQSASTQTFSKEDAPVRQVAIVFGAQVRRDGMPSAVLRDRIETAVKLYKNGKVEKLLMSGDNRFVDYNEPKSMRRYALTLGVPDADIVLDYAGRRTYDTCYRAKEVFGVNSAILVTQGFHLPRALFLCKALGIDAVGVGADNYYYLKRLRLYWNARELFASAQSVFDIYLWKPIPVLGKPEPIF